MILIVTTKVWDLNVFETAVKCEFTFEVILPKDFTSAGTHGGDFG